MPALEHFRPKSRVLYGLDHDSDLSTYLSDTACTNATHINKAEAWRLNEKALLSTVFMRFRGNLVVTNGQVVDRTYIPIDTHTPLHELLGSGSKFVLKPSNGISGNDVEIVQAKDHAAVLRKIRFMLRREGHVLTDWVEQAPYAKRIWPDAANTIRVLTMRPFTGAVFVASAVHRFGNSQSTVTDNWKQGGLSASISSSGVVGSAAHQHNSEAPTWHDTHPDTGGKIKGARVPHWDDLQALALTMAMDLPGIPYVGWDFVATSHGPILLEANADPGVHIHQVHSGLLADDRVRRFYADHGVAGLK